MAAKKDKKKDKSKKMKVKVKLSTLLIVKVSIGITVGLLIVLLGFGLCVIGFNAEINRVIQKNTTYASTGESSPVFMYVDQETSMKYIYMSWAGSIGIGFGTFVVMVGVVYYLERYEHEERSLIAVAAAKEEKIGTEPGKVNFYDIMMAKFRAQRQERGTEGEAEAVATEGQAVEGGTATEGETAPEAPAEVKKEETQSTLQPPPHLPPIEPPSSSSEKKRKKSKLFKAPSYHVLSESDLPVPAVQREDSAAKKANIRFHVPPKLPPLQSVLSSSSSDDKLFFSRHEGGSPKSRRRDTLVSNGSTTDSVINLIPGDDKGGNTEST